MSLKYFDASADTADVITALQDDGAAVVNSVVDSKVVDAILGKLADAMRVISMATRPCA